MKVKSKAAAAVVLIASLIGLGAVLLYASTPQPNNPDQRRAQGAYKPDIRPGAP